MTDFVLQTDSILLFQAPSHENSHWLEASKEAPAFKTRKKDQKLPRLSQFEEESYNNTNSTSSSPDEAKVVTYRPKSVKVKTKATNIKAQAEVADAETETKDANLIRHKDPQIREIVRWKIDGAMEKFYDGLALTDSWPIKRPFSKEYEIIIIELHKYPKFKRRFNEYELAWMGKAPRSY